MKQSRINLVWGLILILVGSVFLVQQLGLIADLAAGLWAFLFAGASLLFFITYFTSGLHQWGWLFPATITAGLAATIWLSEAGLAGTLAGAVFMASVSLPFWLVFAIDRRENWWALIPGWATAVITLVILLADRVAPELVGSLMLFGIALPFLIIYNRFPEHWWALIPAGILVTTGVVALLASIEMSEAVAARLLGGVSFLGMAATFGWLWLKRDQAPTDWARYPAAGLAVAALLVLALGTRMEVVWPAVLIIIGVWLLYNASHRSKLGS